MSQLPLQSSSAPLQVSAGGVQEAAPGLVQEIVQRPVPVLPHVVVHWTLKPTAHSKVSSMFPSQLSSIPLQVSPLPEGVQVSQSPSPFSSDQPGLHSLMHVPASQSTSAFSPAVHTFPHSPQLFASLVASTHALPQGIFPDGHSRTHAEALHTSKGWHSLSHLPQWLWFVAVSTQAPPHGVCPAGQSPVISQPSSSGTTGSSMSESTELFQSRLHAGSTQARRAAGSVLWNKAHFMNSL